MVLAPGQLPHGGINFVIIWKMRVIVLTGSRRKEKHNGVQPAAQGMRGRIRAEEVVHAAETS